MTEYSFYSGAFTEWTTFFVYASDIFLILALFFWFISVLKNSSFKELLKNAVFVIPSLIFISINSGENPDLKKKTNYKNRILLVLQTLFGKMGKNDFTKENMKDKDDICKYRFCLDKISKFLHDKFKKTTKLPKVWLFLLVFLVWITLNLVVNNDYFKISVFQTVKLIELSLLVIFVYFNLKNNKILLTSLFIMVFSGFLQSLIAIYQFIAQHSVFTYPILAKITGESVIGSQIPGVAKIIVDGEKIIRVYGTFPHPNILGGFLIFTILITIYLYSEHKKGILSSKLDIKTHSENKQMFILLCLARTFKFIYIKIANSLRLFRYNSTNRIKSQGILYSLLWITLIFTQTTALFFTFSRTAWAGFLLSLFIISIFYFYNHKIVSRETIKKIYSSHYDRKSGTSPFIKGGWGDFEASQDFSLIESLNRQKIFLLNEIKRFLHFSANWRIQLSDKIVSRETIDKKCSSPDKGRPGGVDFLYILNDVKNIIFKFKELFIAFSLLIFLIISNFSLIQARIGGDLLSISRLPNNSAISDRSFYNNVSRETISENFILGSGLGTYIFQIDDFVLKSFNSCLREGEQTLVRLRECAIRLNLTGNNGNGQMLQSWQYQPAHNIYFLIASEIGVIGLLFFLLFMAYIISGSIKIVSRETIEYNSSSDKRNCKNSPLERDRLQSKQGVLEVLQNHSLKPKIRNFFSFLLNIFTLRHFKPLLTTTYQEENQNSSPDKGRLGGVFEESQNYNLKSNKIVSRETILDTKQLNYFLLAILISFLFMGLFDHYFWTLQQGRLMFWLVLGLILASSNIISKENKY